MVLVDYLIQKTVLSQGKLLVLSAASRPTFNFDFFDRSESVFRKVFADAGLTIIRREVQMGFPAGQSHRLIGVKPAC